MKLTSTPKLTRTLVASGACALALMSSGCATFAEPCSDAWLHYEAQEAFAPVRQDARRTLNQLRAASASANSPTLMTALRLKIGRAHV